MIPSESNPISPVQGKSEKKRLALVFRIFYLALGVSLVLYGVCCLSPAFADGMNRSISSVLRAVLAHLTNFIPFSLAEYLVLLIPILLVFLILFGLRRYSDSWHDVLIYCASLLSVLALVLSLFLTGFAPAYRTRTLDEKLGLDRADVSAEELYRTAMILKEEIVKDLPDVAFGTDGFSVMPYSLREMNGHLLDAYDKICEEHSFVQRLNSNVKPVMLSEAMSYTHITGVYSFFTGEANLNVAFPDYTLPYTAAHELAHQRGIAREDEANFMAFLVCAASDDPYIRYSGYRSLLDHVSYALSCADTALYRELYSALPYAVLRENSAYSNFFQKYRNSKASEVSETVNNTFLIIQGTEGTKSYGMVVDLAVAYYKAR